MKKRPLTSPETRAVAALLLLTPAPTAGVLISMLSSQPNAMSRTAFIACKVWVLLLPILWHVAIDREKIAVALPDRRSLLAGLVSGLALSVAVVAAYLLFGHSMVAHEDLRNAVATLNIGTPVRYIAGATYWICINAALEEYVWRWFYVRKIGETPLRKWRIPISALAFTFHHIVALSLYCSASGTILASVGIFVGSMVWSGLYLRHRNIWGAYLSHALVDVTIFILGYYILF